MTQDISIEAVAALLKRGEALGHHMEYSQITGSLDRQTVWKMTEMIRALSARLKEVEDDLVIAKAASTMKRKVE